MCVCVRACVRVPRRVGVCMRVRACSLTYPPRNPMRHIMMLFAAHLSLPHYLINGTIFEKHLLNIKCVF
jgi:hypothetical protein